MTVLSLPKRPLLDLKKEADPAEFSRFLRAEGPVFRWEPDGLWVVTDYELALAVLKGEEFSADRSAFFASRVSRCPFHKVADFFGVVKKMMVNSDPPEHAARRRLAAFGLADHVLEEFKPAVDRAVDALLGEAAGKEAVDFVREIALPLPCTVLADLFAVPPERRADFYRWSNDMTQFFGGASDDVERDAFHANHGAASLREYFSGLIRERRASPQGDFLSRMLKNQQDVGLDDGELISQAVMMLVAGTVTTTDQLCNDLNILLARPGAAAVERLDAAIEEATRLDPAVNFVFRAARRDCRLGPAAIRAGELVFISTHAVNRDPRVFEEPDSFRLDRPRNPHLSYGSGIHQCLGARLGRIQMRSLFEALLRRFPAVRLAPGRSKRKHQSLAFSGFEELGCQLAPEEAA